MSELPDRMANLVFTPELTEELFEQVITPLKNGQAAAPGLLLYGPPGTGKTSIARAIAGETGAYLIHCDPASVRSKWSGGSEKFIKAAFEKALQLAGSVGSEKGVVLFFDEIDELLTDKESVNGDGAESQFKVSCDPNKLAAAGVVVVGATNHLGRISDAVCDRLGNPTEVPIPPLETLVKIVKLRLESYLGRKKHNVTTAQLSAFTKQHLHGKGSMRRVDIIIASAIRRADSNHRYLTITDLIKRAAKKTAKEILEVSTHTCERVENPTLSDLHVWQ